MMKVDRFEFIEAVNYVGNVNRLDIDELDLSEFFDVESEEFKSRKEEWEYIGLSNKDFILMNDDIWKEKE